MEEAPKTDEELRLEIQDQDHSYYVSSTFKLYLTRLSYFAPLLSKFIILIFIGH